ncbi:MAG: hypothetical protein V3U04_05910, partial [Candidatus Aerophobetes bacterium]
LLIPIGSALLSTVGRSNGAQGHWCWNLLPVIGVSWMALHLGPGVALALMGFLICLMRASAGLTHRRLRPRHQA